MELNYILTFVRLLVFLMVSLVLQYILSIWHTAPRHHRSSSRSGATSAHTGGTTTARADRPCLFIVKRGATGGPLEEVYTFVYDAALFIDEACGPQGSPRRRKKNVH